MPKELPTRKYPLMMRDPLVKNFDKKFKQWLKNRDDGSLQVEEYQLRNQVKEKWAVGIYIPETTIQGLTDHWLPTTHSYMAVEDGRKGGVMRFDENMKMTWASFDKNGLIFCDPHKIPIIIDPTILTLNDVRMVKEAVWDIVKAEIGKRKDIIKGRDFAVPTEEPDALAALFRCRADTFSKYIRWFDLKRAGLSFRLIALIEGTTKSPEDRDTRFQYLMGAKKNPHIGKAVHGEDAVRAGFNLIYQAIFRMSAPSKEESIPTIGNYNCPIHGQECPEDCEYLIGWMREFDNAHKGTPLREQLIKLT
jgi:hypothetical protein